MSISGKCTRTDELAQAGMRSGRPPARINTDCGFADPRGKGFAEGAKGALDVLGPDPTRLAIGLGSEPLTGLIGPERPKGAEAELGEGAEAELGEGEAEVSIGPAFVTGMRGGTSVPLTPPPAAGGVNVPEPPSLALLSSPFPAPMPPDRVFFFSSSDHQYATPTAATTASPIQTRLSTAMMMSVPFFQC